MNVMTEAVSGLFWKSGIRDSVRQLFGVLFLLLAMNSHAIDVSPDVWSMPTSKASSSLLLDIARAGDRLVAVGQYGHIIFSDDNGENWTQAKVPTRQLLTAVYFVTPKKGWAVGHDGLVLHSTDGGENWAIQRDGLAATATDNKHRLKEARQAMAQRKQEFEEAQEALLVAQSDPEADISELELAVEDAQIALEDAEFDVEDVEIELVETVAHPLFDIWFKDEREGYSIGAYGVFLRTRDGGKTWVNSKDNIDNPDELHYNSVIGMDDGALVVAGEQGTFYRSSDRGDSWELLSTPYQGSFFGVFNDGRDVYVSGLVGKVFRSSDNGDSWEALDSKTDTALYTGWAENGQVVIVGGSGVVIDSANRGDEFSQTVRSNLLTNTSVIRAPNGRIIAVGQGGVQVLEHLDSKVGLAANNK